MGSLRTILALAVVLNHSPWKWGSGFVYGHVAVQLFYMISGFVIAHVLLNVPAYRDPRTFYATRALRLFPVYYAVLALTLAWLVVAQSEFFAIFEQVPPAARAVLAVTTATLFGQDWVLFLGVNDGALHFTRDFQTSDVPLWQGLAVPQAWTLGLEIAFYLIAPFVVPRKRLVWALIAASLGARLAAIALGWGGKDPWTYRFFPFELALFLLGVVAYQALLPPWKRIAAAPGMAYLPHAATALLLAMCVLYPSMPGSELAKLLVLFAAFLALMPLTFLFQQECRPDRAIGELSYPLYIGHYLLIWVCTRVFAAAGIEDARIRTVAYVAACLVLALLLQRFVARPVEAVRASLRAGPAAQRPSSERSQTA